MYTLMSRPGAPRIHVVEVDPAKSELVINPYVGRRTTSFIAHEMEADLCVQLDGYYTNNLSACLPTNSVYISNYRVYQALQFDYRPAICINDDGRVELTHQRLLQSHRKYVGSGTRYLVQNGVVNPRLTGWEKNSRTLIGMTASGKLKVVVVDGYDLWSKYATASPSDFGMTTWVPSVGLTVPQCAEFMLSIGCVIAIEFDGGGSSTMFYKGGIVNTPNDDGILAQRAVPNFLVVRGLQSVPLPPPPPPVEERKQILSLYNDGTYEVLQ